MSIHTSVVHCSQAIARGSGPGATHGPLQASWPEWEESLIGPFSLGFYSGGSGTAPLWMSLTRVFKPDKQIHVERAKRG